MNTSNNVIRRAANQLNNKVKARRAANNTSLDKLSSVANNKNRRNNNTGSGWGANQQTVITILATILVIAVLLAAGRWLWRYHRDEQAVAVSTVTVLDGANAGDNEFAISTSQMPPSTYSNEYALSFWIYVDDYNYRRDQDKFILRRGQISHGGAVNPEIRLLPHHNTLEVTLGLQTEESPSYASQQHHPECAAASGTADSFTNIPARQGVDLRVPTAKVHPTQELADSYFATMDGIHVLPAPTADKKRGLALARLHQEHAERFHDSPDPSSGASVPGDEGSSQQQNGSSEESTTGEEDCVCTCGASAATASTPLTRDEWYKKAAKCMVPDFPLQKWVHVVVSQYNQVLDVFVDGHLASSCPLPGFPAISTDNLVLCPDGGFSGRIARVTYSNTSLAANEVYAVYQKGPDSSYKPIRQQVPMWAIVTVIVAILLVVALIVI